MKKTSRKLLSMLLALVMVVSVMSVGAMAAETSYELTTYGEDVAGLSITGAFNIEADSVVIGATGTTYTYINGISGTSQTIDLSDGAVHLVQIIAQNGAASPYVTVLRLQK